MIRLTDKLYDELTGHTVFGFDVSLKFVTVVLPYSLILGLDSQLFIS